MLCAPDSILDRLPSGNSFHRVEVFAALDNRPCARSGGRLACPTRWMHCRRCGGERRLLAVIVVPWGLALFRRIETEQ
jgi:hypothetical protein